MGNMTFPFSSFFRKVGREGNSKWLVGFLVRARAIEQPGKNCLAGAAV